MFLYRLFAEYGYFKGQVLNAEDLDCLYDGLKHNKLHEQFSHILTGIVATINFITSPFAF